GGVWRYARPTDSGTSSNKYVKIIRCSASLGVSYGHDSFLDNERYASPARPTPARASQPRWVVAHSWALRGVARRSNTPCAPWSPGTGSHRLCGRFGSAGSLVCCASYPVRARYQSASPGTILFPTIALTVGQPTYNSRRL